MITFTSQPKFLSLTSIPRYAHDVLRWTELLFNASNIVAIVYNELYFPWPQVASL